MRMIYGMGKDVAQVTVAVNGMTHLTSASISTTPHEDMEIRLFSDFATISNHYHSYSSVSLIEIYVR